MEDFKEAKNQVAASFVVEGAIMAELKQWNEYISTAIFMHESKELTSSMRWSKAVTMFEDYKRLKAVEQEADREDLFRNYLVDLQKKEKAKAQEEYRRNRLEFRVLINPIQNKVGFM